MNGLPKAVRIYLATLYRRLQNAVEYAEDNLENLIDFHKASSCAFMSVVTFYRMFEIFAGMNFMEYVRKRRLGRGKHDHDRTAAAQFPAGEYRRLYN